MNKLIHPISSIQVSEEDAVQEIAHKISKVPSPGLTILFLSNEYDINKISQEVSQQISVPLIGCTTAGEISEAGYQEKSISGLTLEKDEFLIESILIKDLDKVEEEDFSGLLKKVRANESQWGNQGKTFGILLIDGLSVKEEMVVGVIGNLIEDIPLIGGSAGDGLNFGHTFLIDNEGVYENAASVIFVTTKHPFEIFKIQHFEETQTDLVITEAIPEKRIVTEIDGEPAAEAYANFLGIEISEFSPQVFSKYPLMLKVGDEFFVRSIQKVNPDGSLTFYCAIDNGLVLTLAKRQNFYSHIKGFFEEFNQNHGKPVFSLLFECILRRLEVLQMEEEEIQQICDLYCDNRAVGFHTYGEQFGAIHINQTLTGVIFGSK